MQRDRGIAVGNFVVGSLTTLWLLWFLFLYYPPATSFYEEGGLANFTVPRVILILALLLSLSNFYFGLKNLRGKGSSAFGIIVILATIIVTLFSTAFALNSVYYTTVNF